MKTLRRIFYRTFKCYRRTEFKCVTYSEGDRLIRESVGKPEPAQWRIAIPEEDRNRVIGVVYLERRERITV